MSRLLTLLGGGSSVLGPQWTAVRRAPLPPFPPGPQTTIPPSVPAGRDLRYYRGNFCGVRVPNAPVVPGCNPANPELVMACLLDNYPRAVQEQYLTIYAEAGFTHLQRSLGHALYYGSTLEQYIALSSRVRSAYGLFCDQWILNGGEGDDAPLKIKNQDATYWRPILTPIVQRLVGAGVVDTSCVAWQFDQQQQSAPGNPTISIIALVAELLPSSVPLYTHWVNEALAWWYDDGRGTVGQVWSDKYQTIFVNDRFSFWKAMGPYLTGGHHQGNTTMARLDPVQYQGRIRDTLNAFQDGRMGQSTRAGAPTNFLLNEFECTAQDQFSKGENQFVVTGPNNAPYPGCPVGTVVGAPCSELEGDSVGCILACTKADGFDAWVGGYGNGARRPDGSAL